MLEYAALDFFSALAYITVHILLSLSLCKMQFFGIVHSFVRFPTWRI